MIMNIYVIVKSMDNTQYSTNDFERRLCNGTKLMFYFWDIIKLL